jgi:hypothetical protein
MHRRELISASLSAILLPQGMFAFTAVEPAAGASFVFFDEHYALAASLAQAAPPYSSKIPVGADVTGVWNSSLKLARRDLPLELLGITTDSFRFCLQRLLQSHCYTSTNVERVSQDLYAWSIITTSTRQHRSTR